MSEAYPKKYNFSERSLYVSHGETYNPYGDRDPFLR